MKIISYAIISTLISFWLGKTPPLEIHTDKLPTVKEEPCFENDLTVLQNAVDILEKSTTDDSKQVAPTPLSPVSPTISATKTVMVITDNPPTGNGPGDVLEYTIVISNTGNMEATNVMFNDQIDAHTTLVPNSLKTSPIARPDTYTGVVGNISISIPAGQGLLANDIELDGDAVTVTSINTAGTQGNVSFNADGSFTFNPSPGFEGTTTFTYTSTDGMFNSTSTVSITVSGMIWFINAAAAGPGDGRLSSPFNTIANFNSLAADDPNDNIFMYSGAYSSSLTLLNGQRLIGQGATSFISTLTGLTPPVTSPALPSTGGTNPTIANAATTLTVAMNNRVYGITINNTGGTAFTGNNLGTLVVRDVTLSNNGGIALNLTNGTLDAIFKSISASNASHGIRLDMTSGSMQVTGTGTMNGSGGTFSMISQRGIEMISASNITLKNLTMTNANTLDAGYSGICDESNNTNCNAAIYLRSVTTISLDNVNITGTDEEGINGNAVSGFSIANSTLAGTGNAEEDNGIKMINMTGTCSMTNCTMGTPGYRIVHIINNTGNVNLTVNNCSFNNTQNSALGQDCFEMRTRNSATATVDLMNSSFIKARSKAIQMQAEDQSTMSVDITNCNIQRMSTLMAGIDIGSVSTATVNFNVNGNPIIESSREVSMLASTASSSILNGRFNGNPSVTYSDSGPSIYATVRMLQEQNSVAKLEVGNNVISATNGQETVLSIARLGSTAASRLDYIVHDNNITRDANGIEGIELRMGQASSPAETNTHCGYIHHNTVTVLMPPAPPNNRAYRVRELNASGDMRLQGPGPTLADNLTANSNTNVGGSIAEFGGLTYSATCNLPTHPGPLMGPPEQGLALDPNEGPDAPAEEPVAAPAPIEAAPSNNDVSDPPVALVMSGETVTVGAPSGFPLPDNQTMTIKFRVTIDPVPAGVCQVANQGTITGSNFSTVMTDDPGTAPPNDPTVTSLSIPPTITTCQPNVMTNTDPDQCTASVMFTTIGQGCPVPTFTYKIGMTTITSPHTFPIGTTTVDVTASNGNLPNATCSFTVQVTDNQAPDITCLIGTQMRGTNLGNCSYTVQGAEFNPTVNENCPGYTLTNNYNNMASLAGAVLPLGPTTVTWTVTDGATLQDMCTVTIQVTDDDAPLISCPPAATTPCNINDLPPYANYTAFTMAGGSASDNCGINAASFMLLSQTGSGTYTRTYQISDVNSLSATCTQTVTVSDMTAPTVTAGTIAPCYPTVAAAEAAAIAATTAMDNCPGMLNYSAATVGTCSAVITVTVSDGANNSNFVTYNTRIDNTAPTVTAGAINACYPTVAAAEAAAIAATTVSDNCPGTVTKMATTVGTCSAVITVTGTDGCGNSNFVTYTTSIDNASPTVTTGTIAPCYPTVAAAEAAAIAATTAMDDCPSSITKTASTVGTCSAVITVTATDGCGNSAMTTYNTRIDNTGPTVTPGSIAPCYQTVAAAEAAAIAATTATDGCPGTVTKTASTMGTCSAVITVTATDGCGNSNATTYSTRIDNTKPTVTAGIIAPCYPTVAAAEAAAIAATTATDNCPGTVTKMASTVGTCSAVITVTASDGCGNSDFVTYSTRIDNTGPTVTPGTIAPCYLTVAAAEAAAIAATTATDGCPGTVTKTASTVGTCSAVITVTGTDGCGNSNSVTYNTRIDNTPPTVTAGSIAMCYPTVAAAEAAALAATTVSDNCPGTVNKTASTVGTCTAVITVTGMDGCGNSNSVTYSTRIDNTGPTITPGTIAPCYLTVAAAEAAALAATTVMDDCPSSIMKTASTVGTCSAVITVTATDGCGNSAMTTYSTKIDNTPPVAVCKNSTIALTGDGNYMLTNADVLNLAMTSDNCGSYTVTTNPTSVNCNNLNQTIPVTVTVSDLCGNSSTCTAQITVIEGTALPSGWTAENIGSTAMGSSQFKPCTNGGAFTLDTKGYTTNTTDVEHSVYRALCGDGEIIAHVASLSPGAGWAGIQMRESSSQGSKKFTLKTQMSTILRREIRTTTFGATNTLQMPVPMNHTWLRITRVGNNFTSYSSIDGVNWFFRSAATIVMNNCIQMGVFVESFNNTITTTAVIDNVTTSGSGGTIPPPSIVPSVSTDSYLSVQIFPNPTTGVTNIVLENVVGKTGTLIVYNGQGQQVLTRQIQELSQQEQIDLTHFADGVYWVKIQVEGYLPVTRKLIRTQVVKP